MVMVVVVVMVVVMVSVRVMTCAVLLQSSLIVMMKINKYSSDEEGKEKGKKCIWHIMKKLTN